MKNTTTDQIFRRNLMRLRNNRKLSQAELSLNAHLDRSYISLIERGDKSPTLRTIISLANALDVEVIEFFLDTEDL